MTSTAPAGEPKGPHGGPDDRADAVAFASQSGSLPPEHWRAGSMTPPLSAVSLIGSPAAGAAMPPSVSAIAARLSETMWRTRGARFNASRRLQIANERSLRLLSWLSAYAIVVGLGIGVPVFGLSPAAKDVAGFVATALSLFILVLSVLESTRSYQARAGRLHDCARDIGPLMTELELALAQCRSEAELEPAVRRVDKKYRALIRRCSDNHDPSDDALFRAQHYTHFKISRGEALRIRARHVWRPTAVYFATVLGPILAGIWYLVSR